MQIKKDQLFQSIINYAEKEFFEKGFRNASLRSIAKMSGTTIGNLYHYFESKEDLFDKLVRDEYEGFICLINNHKNIVVADDIFRLQDAVVIRKILKKAIDHLLPIFSKRFYILLKCSEGTKYEKVSYEFKRILEEHFSEHLRESNSNCANELGGIIAEQFISSIIAIMRDYSDDEKISELVTEMLMYTFMGVMGVLGYTQINLIGGNENDKGKQP